MHKITGLSRFQREEVVLLSAKRPDLNITYTATTASFPSAAAVLDALDMTRLSVLRSTDQDRRGRLNAIGSVRRKVYAAASPSRRSTGTSSRSTNEAVSRLVNEECVRSLYDDWLKRALEEEACS